MSELLIGLAGGAIGAVLAGIGFVVVRLSAVPGEVVRHDRRIAALDEDLERWVADDHRKLRHQLNRVTNEFAAKGMLYSGVHLAGRSEAKTHALQRYRDRLSESERALADIRAEEGWPHERWRRWKKVPAVGLCAPARVEAVIDEWRRASLAADMTEGAQVYDPTRFTMQDLLADICERPLEGVGESQPSSAIRVEVREAWRPPRVPFVIIGDMPPTPEEPDIFEGTVVAINVIDEPVFVEVLGLESMSDAAGYDDRLDSTVREVPPGGNVSLAVAEDMVDFDMRSGVRGYAELATGPRIYSEVLILTPPSDLG